MDEIEFCSDLLGKHTLVVLIFMAYNFSLKTREMKESSRLRFFLI